MTTDDKQRCDWCMEPIPPMDSYVHNEVVTYSNPRDPDGPLLQWHQPECLRNYALQEAAGAAEEAGHLLGPTDPAKVMATAAVSQAWATLASALRETAG